MYMYAFIFSVRQAYQKLQSVMRVERAFGIQEIHAGNCVCLLIHIEHWYGQDALQCHACQWGTLWQANVRTCVVKIVYLIQHFVDRAFLFFYLFMLWGGSTTTMPQLFLVQWSSVQLKVGINMIVSCFHVWMELIKYLLPIILQKVIQTQIQPK